MILENPNNYKFIKFQKAENPAKKYDAILLNLKTGKTKRIPFGDSAYEHYKDKTPLKLYSHLDHLSPYRRELFRKRIGDGYKNKYSSAYFSYNFLW